MKLEDQVVSLELAKRLKELGVKQEAHFWWFSVKGDREKDCYVSCEDGGYGYRICAAPTVGELGEILPFYRIGTDRRPHGWRLFDDMPYIDNTEWPLVDALTEADARAKMLIHLLETGLAKPGER